MDQQNVTLKPASEGELWIFERQSVEPDAGGIFNWSGFRNLAGTRRRLTEDGLISADGGCLIVWAEGTATGTVSWRRVHYGTPTPSCWNIGVQILPEHRRRGIGTEGQAQLTRYLFDTSPVHRVEAHTDVENDPEQRALSRIGFVREGLLRAVQFREGRWRDMYLYAMTREDYSGVPW
ncbi:alanine acetyltransferase [Actinoplanes ianthinogenes]|uniref:Alanine acetyltransferase n=1 Tax=Actinoplanes ianthinogenes TaxID=122358 RepID=A0ABN6CQW7_9ACTN|nr:GNAT family protein [Actinoplanes ianthinogenes]BCJ47014.1 alanine acetyltransferase [Actinoplanes ianthinogenes]GGR13929.1 alanine acetyltransferase [Actinoplanes ianthinogenes]